MCVSDLSGFTHHKAANVNPVVTLLYHKQDKSPGFNLDLPDLFENP